MKKNLRKMTNWFKGTKKAASDMVVTLMLTVIVIALCLAFNTWINGATSKVYTNADNNITSILGGGSGTPTP